MPEIDELTGLPEIPEDHQWVVGPIRNVYPPGTMFYGGVHYATTDEDESRKASQVRLEKISTVTHQLKGTVWERLFKRTPQPVLYTNTSLVDSQRSEGTHPIAIRNAAQCIMKRLEAKREASRHYGVYPPKRLED